MLFRSGRMPETAGECLADVDQYTQEDIGKTFTVVEENTEKEEDKK